MTDTVSLLFHAVYYTNIYFNIEVNFSTLYNFMHYINAMISFTHKYYRNIMEKLIKFMISLFNQFSFWRSINCSGD